MKPLVFVLGRNVATRERSGDFKIVLAYSADIAPVNFVSLIHAGTH